MRLRTLGKTGLQVTEIGFGGIPIQRVTAQETKDILKACMEHGVGFIDSARGYTISEEMIGQAIEGHRDRFVLATKTGVRDYESMTRDIEVSLKNFKTDHIDLYQSHFVRNKEQYDMLLNQGGYDALLDAKKAGKIRFIGITSHSADLLAEAVEDNRFDTVQFPYNLLETQGEKLFARCAELNVGVIAMKPAAGGAISNVPLSLKYILNNPALSVAIPGMDSVEQVAINSAVGQSSLVLSPSELEEIEGIRKSMGNQFCRRCGYCLPCPVGIDIPTQFLLEGYLTRYSLPMWSYDRYDALPVNAKDCVACGVCETRCPYDLPIIEMLKNVAIKMKR